MTCSWVPISGGGALKAEYVKPFDLSSGYRPDFVSNVKKNNLNVVSDLKLSIIFSPYLTNILRNWRKKEEKGNCPLCLHVSRERCIVQK